MTDDVVQPSCLGCRSQYDYVVEYVQSTSAALTWVGQHTATFDCSRGAFTDQAHPGEFRRVHISDNRWIKLLRCGWQMSVNEACVNLVARNMHILTSENFGEALRAYMTLSSLAEENALHRGVGRLWSVDALLRYVQALVDGQR